MRLLIWWLGTHESLLVHPGWQCVPITDVHGADITVWIRVSTRTGLGHLPQHGDGDLGMMVSPVSRGVRHFVAETWPSGISGLFYVDST